MIIPTSIKSNTAEFSTADKKVLLRIEKSKTMAIFMKLLATKIVANKRLGFFNNLITLVTSILFSVSLDSSKDLSCREKKATSAPETRAEQNNKKITSPN